MFKKEDFLSFYIGTPNEKGASQCYDLVSQSLADIGILTDMTLIGALATARIEVGRAFLPIAESKLTGIFYEYRKDLGNINMGDGVKYRGRGYIQLTGRNNYDEYGKKLGIDLVSNPDKALDPLIASQILAQYFKDRAVAIACNARKWMLVRELVNGGINGLTAFLNVVNQYIIKITNPMKKLDIIKLEYTDTQTVINWERYNTDDQNQHDLGAWTVDGELTPDEAVAHAKTMVDSDISVALNLKA